MSSSIYDILLFFCMLIAYMVLSLLGFNITSLYFFYFILICFLVNKYFIDIKKYLYAVFVFYIFISGSFYSSNFVNNPMGFGPNFDDSFYYKQSYDFLYNYNSYKFDTIFEIIISPFVYFSQSVFDVIGINWVISVLNLGVLYRIFKLINCNFNFFYLFFLVLNYFYIEASVFLYRDQLGLLLLLSAILFYLKNNKLKSFTMFFLCIFVRPTTALFFILFLFLKKNKYVNNIYRNKSLVLVFMFLIFLLAYQFLPLGFLTRSGFTGEVSTYSLADLTAFRSQYISSDSNDFTSKLLSLGIIAFPLVFVLNIFSPIRFRPLYENFDFYQWVDSSYVVSYSESLLSYKGILTFFHIIIISFCIIPFFYGIKNLVFYHKNKLYLILLFFLALFFVSYVSYQPRHKLHFLIFVPLIISYSNFKADKYFLFGLIILFFLSIPFIMEFLI